MAQETAKWNVVAAADLIGIVLVTIGTALTLFAGLLNGWVRVLVTGAFILIVPGYALIAALFPASRRAPMEHSHEIALSDRLFFSIVSSLALVPIIGITLDLFRVPVTGDTVSIVLAVITLISVAVAQVRRGQLAKEQRFDLRMHLRRSLGEFADTDAPLGRDIVSIVLIFAVIGGAGGVVYAAANPAPENPYTAFSITTGNNGTSLNETVNAVEPGESLTTHLSVANHERQEIVYTVVVVRQQVDSASDGDTVVSSTELDRFSRTVDSDATWHREHTVTRETGDQGVRIVYQLYTGEDASADSPYRRTFIWLAPPAAE